MKYNEAIEIIEESFNKMSNTTKEDRIEALIILKKYNRIIDLLTDENKELWSIVLGEKN